MKTVAKNFYRAFTDKTGTETDEKQHSEVYHLGILLLPLPPGANAGAVVYVLTKQGILKDIHKPKRTLGTVELNRLFEALWCKLEVPHERARVQYHLLLVKGQLAVLPNWVLIYEKVRMGKERSLRTVGDGSQNYQHATHGQSPHEVGRLPVASCPQRSGSCPSSPRGNPSQ